MQSLRICLLLGALALAALVVVEAKHRHHHHAQDPLFIGSRPFFGFTGQHIHPPTAEDEDISPAQVGNFSAVIDHFNVTKKYFRQRYFNNTAYAAGKGIHFLYVEGEGAANATTITNEALPHVALAKSVGATLWLLEHRYYGKSRPYKKMTDKNLAYLTSQQAVEDIFDFVNRTSNASGDANPKWVIFGASYAGALTLWFRQKYPNMSVGVVAASPQVSPSLDYYTFELNVANALLNTSLGGSFHCNEGARFAARAVREELQYVEGVTRLNSELQLAPPLNESGEDYKTFQYLHTQLMPLLQLPVLYNKVNIGPFATQAGINDLCPIMRNESLPNIEKIYTWVGVLFTAMYGSQDAGGNWTILNRYSYALDALRDVNYHEDNLARASARNWLWQMCHEFGGYTSTDNGRNIFGSEVPNSYFIALCSDVIGGDIHETNFTVNDLQANINKVKKQFDTTAVFKGTNALIIGGDADPWKSLQVNATTDPSSTFFLMPGMGHSAALTPPTNSDTNELNQARQLINTNVNAWLSGSSSASARTTENRAVAEQKRAQDETEEEAPAKWTEPKSLLSHFSEEGPAKPNMPKGKEIRSSAPSTRFQSHHTRRMQARMTKKGIQANALNHTVADYLWTGWIVQPVDHFNTSDSRTWKQKYFTNNKNVETHHAPQFLMLGGETAIDFTYVSGEFLQYVIWGKDFNAMLHALEHRFYGESQPFNNDISVDKLLYLTNEQVLADVATYITTTNTVKNLTTNRWIVFGGSYSGSLVAMFRVRYPDLSIGGIASSAPIQAIGDFYSYMQDVSTAVDTYGMEGCGEGIRRFFYELRRLFNTRDGRLIVKEDFCIWNDWYVENYIDEKDAEYFLADLVFYVDEVVQYDDEDHWWLQYLCEFFRDFWGFSTVESKSLVQALGKIAAQVRTNSTEPHLVKARSAIQNRQERRNQLDAEIRTSVTPSGIKHRVKADANGRPVDPFSRAVIRHQRLTTGVGVKGAMKTDIAQNPDGNSQNLAAGHNQLNSAVIKPDDGGSYDNYDDQSEKSASDSNNGEGSNWSGSSSLDGEGDESLECYCWGCWYVSYDETLWILQETTYDFWDWEWWRYADQRIWMWQTCTMWGYQISTDFGRNFFEDSLPINFLIDYCPDIFGDDYNRTRLDNGVSDTNWRYGGQDNYNGTNVVFVNGSEDPWHMLSVFGPHQPLQGDNGNVTVMLIPGTSHCQDMYKWEPGDKDVVKVAHKKLKAILIDWVENSKPASS